MPYRQRKNKHTSVVIGGVVLVCIVLILLFHKFLPALALPVARPILKTAHAIGDGIERTVSIFRYGEEGTEQRELLREYKNLHDELLLKVTLLQSENTMLRQELGLRGTDTSGNILAAVLSYPPITPFDILLIDAGTDKGIEAGNAVFAGDGIFIGTIRMVSKNTAEVSLFSTPARKTEGLVARTETAIVLDGIGGGGFEFVAPEGFDVTVGDLIVTPGSEQHAIGRVAGIEKDENGSFRTVFIEQPINIRHIQWVRIDTQEA